MNFLSEIASHPQLEQAWNHVKRKKKVTPGIDNIGIKDFENNWKRNIELISKELKSGKYTFNKVLEQYIPKKKGSHKKRPIRMYTVRDKVVQTSFRITLERIRKDGSSLFSEIQNSVSIGYLDKQYYKGDCVGVKLAVKRIQELYKEGYMHFIKADIEDFFGNIERDRLKTILEKKLEPDKKLSHLISEILNPIAIKKDRYTNNETLLPMTSSGVAQGSVISPLLSNIYLIDFDKSLENIGVTAIRYADDLIVATKSRSTAKKLVVKIEKLLHIHSNLNFHPKGNNKEPKIYSIYGGFDFLGVYIQKLQKAKLWSIRPSLEKTKDQRENITRSLNPKAKDNLSTRISYLNRSISSWFSTYIYAGCTKSELKKIYIDYKELYCKHVNHLLKINHITKTTIIKGANGLFRHSSTKY